MQRLKSFYFLGLFLCLNYSIYAQSEYHEYTVENESVIFYDDFDNNKNGWALLDRQEIVNGKLIDNLYRENAASPALTRYIKINTARDFEIETSFKIVKDLTSYKKYHNTIAWGKSDNQHSFYFGINSSGQYTYGKTSGSYNSIYIIKSVKSDHINLYKKKGLGKYNKITIRKIGKEVYFFINEQYVNKAAFEPFFGNNLSFVNANTVEVDYLKIGYLKRDLNNYPPKLVISKPDINSGSLYTESKTVRVTGKATDNNGIYEITANGIEATLQSGGSFFVDVPLAVGNNTITITAKDTKMKSSTTRFEVRRKAAQIAANNPVDEKRVALVFGNSNYTGSANLGDNPINDARDIASTLRAIGFDVILKTDASLNTMNTAIREFGRKNKDADVALFYFAGHGMQVERINYVLPIGTKINDKNDVNFECVSVTTVQKLMETSNSDRLNLIVLDACRNNPFRKWQRGGETGLADMTPPSGTLIAFATSPGSTALNGRGRNGLYTGALIKELKKSQRIEDVFINTRIEVENKSGGQQSPWELARLRGVYYLKK